MNIKKYAWAGFVFTLILGSLTHFFYEWSGKSAIVGAFSAVNESSWEHLKLLATPFLIWSVIGFFAGGRKIKNFVPVQAVAALLGMFTVIASFYTYTGIIGTHFLAADIGTFILGAFTAFCFSYKNLGKSIFSTKGAVAVGWLLVFVTIVCFVVFTFHPPKIPLFQDPVTGLFGI